MIKDRHFYLYKPCGMLSQLSSGNTRQRSKKRFLSELSDFPPGSMPIGRLDEKSEGLLLMTTDGKFSDWVNRSGLEKEYYAQFDGVIDKTAIEQLQNGVEIGFEGKRYKTQPCQAHLLEKLPSLPPADPRLRIGYHRPGSWISITISEGKFRQIRKMTAAVGFPTLRLVRMRIGPFRLIDLQPGQVLSLDPEILGYR